MNIPKHISKKIQEQGSITSKEYREILLNSNSRGSKRKSAELPQGLRQEKSLLDGISYKYNVKQVDDKTVEVSITGKHFSRNVFNSFSFKEKLKLKKLIKDSAQLFYYSNKSLFVKIGTFEKVTISYKIFNPVSRDRDNNNLKAFQDTFTILGIIKDDNRKVVLHSEEDEVISKEYKIIASICKA